MVASPITDSCSALRDEIRKLEEQLRLLDGELGTDVRLGSCEDEGVSCSLEIEEEILPPPILAKACEITEGPLTQEDPPVENVIPFRKVAFREEKDVPEKAEVRLLRWLGFLVVLASLIGLGSIVVLPMLKADEQGLVTASLHMGATLERDILAAKAALREFYRADSIESILAKVREPKALEPLIRAHHDRFPLVPCEIDFDDGAERVHHDEETFVLAVVSLPEATHGRRVAVAMTSEGPKVDWELATNAQKHSWQRLPPTPIMMSGKAFRVDLQQSNYFNHGFEESEWTCFRMTAPEDDAAAFAYAPRRSQLSEQLHEAIQQEGAGTAQVIVSVAVGGRVDELPQVRILELIRDHWILNAESLPLLKSAETNMLSSN
ncbi:MAG: hypothetical protein ACI957_000089 [Verrucomicrobiales bacterium]|jgi:hypothetical protein